MLPSLSGASESPTTSLPSSSSSSSLLAQFSCLLCKQRKVRCDRASPCSGCVRAGVQCEPGVRQPYKRRRRHGSSRDENLSPRSRSDSISSRALESRPIASAEDVRPDRPQVPTFGQYVAFCSHPHAPTWFPILHYGASRPPEQEEHTCNRPNQRQPSFNGYTIVEYSMSDNHADACVYAPG